MYSAFAYSEFLSCSAHRGLVLYNVQRQIAGTLFYVGSQKHHSQKLVLYLMYMQYRRGNMRGIVMFLKSW